MRGQFLAHTHQADPVHLKHDGVHYGRDVEDGGGGDDYKDNNNKDKTDLNDMIVDPDASVTVDGDDVGDGEDVVVVMIMIMIMILVVVMMPTITSTI